jgi:hypothetical protein
MFLQKSGLKMFCISGMALFSFFEISAQRQIAEIRLPVGTVVKDIQTIVDHDSLFLFYRLLPNSADPYYVSNFILPDGRVRKIDVGDLDENPLAGIISVNSDIKQFYFLQEKGKSILLKAMEVNLKDNSKSTPQNKYEIKGKLLGLNQQPNKLLIISLEPSGTELKIALVSRFGVDERIYKLPINLNSFRESEISVIASTQYISVLQALSKVKIFWTPNNVSIIVDGLQDSKKKNYGTLIGKLHKEGEGISKFIPESTDNFRSYLVNNRLYRFVNKTNEITLTIFDVTSGEQSFTTTYLKGAEYSHNSVIFREGKKDQITMMSNIGEMVRFADRSIPFVTAKEDTVNKNLWITCGSYFNEKGATLPLFPNPATLIAALIGTMTKQLSEGPGISRYFYLKIKPDNSSSMYTKDPENGIRQKIDNYEIDLNASQKGTHKIGYFQYKDGILGLYRKERVFRLVEF